MKAWRCGYLAILVVDPQMHAGRHEQQQRLLLTQLFPETVDHFWTLIGSLKRHHVAWKSPRFPADVKKRWFVQKNTFSFWISLRICDILTFRASSSSSGTCGTVSGSTSSGLWKVSSVSGMHHLLSYCWFFLLGEEEDGEKGRTDNASSTF